jgi:hypothetical protein
MGDLNDRWQPIMDIDPMKRKPREWAVIYCFELAPPISDDLWSEYEWAYHVSFDLRYRLLPDRNKSGKLLDSYDKSSDMELRAMDLKRDLFMGADIGEKYIFNEGKYIETEWVKKRLLLLT